MTPILQSETSECGLACLAMVANAYGKHLEIVDLRRKFSVSLKGITLQQLCSHAEAMNFSTRALRLDMNEFKQLQLPCILHWNLNHFVVLEKVSSKNIVILDPAIGRCKLEMHKAAFHFTGVAFELTPQVNFNKTKKQTPIVWSVLTSRVLGLKKSLTQIFVLAAVLELFAITAPLVNQMVVDDAIATNDTGFLTVLMVGFALLMVVQTAISFARSWMVMILSQNLSLQWSGNIFTHMLRLPLEFFQKRHLGDIVSRFGSIETIRQTLTTSALEAILDGIMACAALAMMLLYSLQLSALVFAALLSYGLLRWAGYRPLRQAAAERLALSARERSHFFETLRSILPLKLFGREEERRARWQNLMVEVQNRDVQTTKMQMGFSAANTLISGVESLGVFWLGGNLVMQGMQSARGTAPFTIGMLFAFISYKDQFSGRVFALIDYIVNIRMLSLQAGRLGDIVLTAIEKDDVPPNSLEHLPASIELKGVSFRYGEGEPWILKDCNLQIPSGDSVAIVGASGCGKTTLLKVILGILKPQEGEVLYGGVSIRHLGLKNYRRQVGTVMQEDVLLAGSIADNISFFDLRPDEEKIRHCAQLAMVHEEICRMPMGYRTYVGDMGSSLSGGQKQRIVMARALYKTPKVLALDEATSHLDVANEQRLTNELSQMEVTRIIVAHRPETIASARIVIKMENGGVNNLVQIEPSMAVNRE